MKLLITSGPRLRKEFDFEQDVNIVYDILDKNLESIETQLRVSIDLIKHDNVVELMCDSQLNPMLFEFICEIAKREIKKVALA